MYFEEARAFISIIPSTVYATIIPAIYYGSEWGFEGKKTAHSDDSLRPHVKLNDLGKQAKHPKLLEAIKQFILVHKNCETLVNGSYETLLVTNEQYAFSRKSTYKTIIVIVNASKKSVKVNIDFKGLSSGVYADLLNTGYTLTSNKTGLSVEVPPCWGRILSH
ncbi:alpha-glucosidase C-terminal domain-containing protein [Zobellia laminariae]|uniref:alpha-glucosidase C-terminal domain-containing protein n=1 Tax=Zobellia laminariae TaxID=248906 RepID=UPI0026F40C0B|nr:alpha-glucosidase C-terminal domain-containing protein [Zobellia laminariae]WKX77887.1 alpha amylase C-terminal domain-containing protein [Zobellia laminariae]